MGGAELDCGTIFAGGALNEVLALTEALGSRETLLPVSGGFDAGLVDELATAGTDPPFVAAGTSPFGTIPPSGVLGRLPFGAVARMFDFGEPILGKSAVRLET